MPYSLNPSYGLLGHWLDYFERLSKLGKPSDLSSALQSAVKLWPDEKVEIAQICHLISLQMLLRCHIKEAEIRVDTMHKITKIGHDFLDTLAPWKTKVDEIKVLTKAVNKSHRMMSL